MTDQTWLQSLKVGDEVAVYFSSSPTIHRIERETTTTWVLPSGTKIRKSDGKVVGVSNCWQSSCWAHEATDARREECEKNKLRHRVETNRTSLSLDQLRRIVAILDEPRKDGE